MSSRPVRLLVAAAFFVGGVIVGQPTALAQEETPTITVAVQFVDAGSKILDDKFKDKDFREKVEKKVNEIWKQAKIEFSFDATVETLDGKKGSKRSHHEADKGAKIHVFLTTGATASTSFKNEDAVKPGEGFITLGDQRFKKKKTLPPKGNEPVRELDACQSLAETLAHELGHALGLRDVHTTHIDKSWFNLMWTKRQTRSGTALGQFGDLGSKQGTPGDLGNNWGPDGKRKSKQIPAARFFAGTISRAAGGSDR